MVTDKAFQEAGVDGHIGMPQSCGTFPMVQSLTSRVRFVEAANSSLSNASNTCFFCSEESTEGGAASYRTQSLKSVGPTAGNAARRGDLSRGRLAEASDEEGELVDRGCANCLAAALALATQLTGAALDQPHMETSYIENPGRANPAKTQAPAGDRDRQGDHRP